MISKKNLEQATKEPKKNGPWLPLQTSSKCVELSEGYNISSTLISYDLSTYFPSNELSSV